MTDLDVRLEGIFQRAIALLLAFPEATVAQAWNRAMLEDALLAGERFTGDSTMATNPNPTPSAPRPAQTPTPQPSTPTPHPSPNPGGTPSR